MKQYTKLIILSIVLVVLIALVTIFMVTDIDLKIFKSLSIAGIQQKKIDVDGKKAEQLMEVLSNSQAKQDLQTSKNSFDVAKSTYESIDKSTIEIVQEATKEEKYFIEYLWIVLGNYAKTNNVGISIITPDSTVQKEETNNEEVSEGNQNTLQGEPGLNNEGDFSGNTLAPISDGVKIKVEGRYADVADFVYDVENDKSLRFKLDNIKMTYAGDNQIQAVFDVLSLSVLK